MADYPASVNARYEFRTHSPLPRLPWFPTPSSPFLSRRPSARWTLPLVAFTLIPGTRPLHPPLQPSDSPLAKQIRGHFSVPWPAYIYIHMYFIYIIYIFGASTPRRRVFHAAKKAPGGSRGVLGWFCFLDNLWPECVCVQAAGQVGGCTRGWMGAWTTRRRGLLGGMGVARSAPGFAGNFFSSEFSKGNDLRYISKGFLLVGKRVRRSAIHPPTEGRLARSRGLPDNLHFSTINLTFVRLFFCGQSDWPYVREDSLSSFPSL